MKKLIFSLGIVLLGMHSGFAQRAKVETGFKVGANLSNFSGGLSQEIAPGAHFSAFIEQPLSFYKQFSVSFELMYSMQGYKGIEVQQYNNETLVPEGYLKTEDVRTHNLYLPIVFNYYPMKGIGIHLGGQVGYMLDASSNNFDINQANPARSFVDRSSNNIEEYLFEQGYRNDDFTEYYNQLDYGIVAGLTIDLSKNAFISARYYLGLNDVYKGDDGLSKLSLNGITEDMFPDPAIYYAYVQRVNFYNQHLNFDPLKNSVFQISFGYKF